jgi:FkbM family methyltransferase
MNSGYAINGPAASGQTWVPAFTGRYDDLELALLGEYFTPETVAIDIGACLGFITVPLADMARARRGRVLAFEPVPGNVRLLRDNLRRNHLDEYVEVISEALGKVQGSFPAWVEEGGAGNAGLVPDSRETGGEPLPFVVRRLDDITIDGRVSIMKIDVEGSEMDVLTGADDLISSDRPVILGEFSQWWFRERGVNPDEPLAWCEEHNYSLIELKTQRARRLSERRVLNSRRLARSDVRETDSVLCLPNELAVLRLVDTAT